MLAEALAAVPALLLLVAAGAGLQALLPAPLERSLAARAGHAFLLGAAWNGTTSWLAGVVFGAPLAPGLFLALNTAAILAGIVAVLLRRDAGGLGGYRFRNREVAWRKLWFLPAIVVVVSTSCALLGDAATEPVSDFDGRMTWGTVAKYLLAERSILPEVLRDPTSYVIHPRYPPLLPVTQATIASLAGASIESTAIRPLYALFLPALFAILAPAVRRAGGSPGGGLALLLIFASPFPIWAKEGGARGTYSDLPLACFLGAALVVLAHPRVGAQAWRGWPAGLLLAAAAGAKNEGTALAPALVLVALLVAWRLGGRVWTARRAPLLRSALVVGSMLALVVVWRSEVPNRNDEAYFEELSPVAVASGLVARSATVARVAAAKSLDVESWGFLFWLLPLLVAVGWRGLRGPAIVLAAITIALALALALAAYAVVPDLSIVAVTWNRFVIQMLVPIALVVAAAARGAVTAFRSSRG